MPFADKSFRSRKATQQNRALPYMPMGDERFRQLMSEMSVAFAQIDDGEEKRRQARERERASASMSSGWPSGMRPSLKSSPPCVNMG